MTITSVDSCCVDSCSVDSYVASVPSALLAVAATFQEMLSAELASPGAVRRGHPVWSVAGQPVAGFRVGRSSVTLTIHRGAEVDDPSGRLVVDGAGRGRVSVRTVAEIDGALFAEWLRQADDLATEPWLGSAALLTG